MFHFAVYNYQSVPSLPVFPPWDSNWLLMVYFCIVFLLYLLLLFICLFSYASGHANLNCSLCHPSFTDVNTLLSLLQEKLMTDRVILFRCLARVYWFRVFLRSAKDFLTDKTPMESYNKMCPHLSGSSCSVVEVCTQTLILPETLLLIQGFSGNF